MIRFLFRLVFRAVALVVLAGMALFVYHLYDSGQLPGVKRQIEDVTVKASVVAAFKLHKDLSERDIRVEADGSHVALRGAVSSDAERDQAVELASNVEGVETVTSELEIIEGLKREDRTTETGDKSFGQRIDETALLTKVRAALHLDRAIREIDLDVRVDGSSVIISGTVPSEELAKRIRDKVASVSGVESVEARLEAESP